jgi:hypothetical protein
LTSSTSGDSGRGTASSSSGAALCGAHLQHLLRLQPPCHCGAGHVSMAQLQQLVAAAAEQQLGVRITGWRGDWSEPPPRTRVQLFVSGLPAAPPTFRSKGSRCRDDSNDDGTGCLASVVQQRLAHMLQPLAPQCSGGWSHPFHCTWTCCTDSARCGLY